MHDDIIRSSDFRVVYCRESLFSLGRWGESADGPPSNIQPQINSYLCSVSLIWLQFLPVDARFLVDHVAFSSIPQNECNLVVGARIVRSGRVPYRVAACRVVRERVDVVLHYSPHSVRPNNPDARHPLSVHRRCGRRNIQGTEIQGYQGVAARLISDNLVWYMIPLI